MSLIVNLHCISSVNTDLTYQAGEVALAVEARPTRAFPTNQLAQLLRPQNCVDGPLTYSSTSIVSQTYDTKLDKIDVSPSRVDWDRAYASMCDIYDAATGHISVRHSTHVWYL